MKLEVECYECFVKQAVRALRHADSGGAFPHEAMREIFQAFASLAPEASPPIAGTYVHRVIRRHTGNPDPYKAEKDLFNTAALAMLPGLRRRIAESADPLDTAVRVAIAGNRIDFGVYASLKVEALAEAVGDAMKQPVHGWRRERFKTAINEARSILYLADNAGEIVFDRLLIERLPREKITLVVRGSPILNDATFDDARTAGLHDLVEILPNGSDTPGTWLEECSAEFRDRFARADVIVAKGQGNYETLSECDRAGLFFLLQAKCPVVARRLRCPVGSMVVFESNCTGKDAEAEMCASDVPVPPPGRAIQPRENP